MAKTNDSQEEKRKKREEWSLPFALPALRSNHGLVGRTGRSLIPLGTPNLQWVAQLNAGDAACSNGGRTGRYSKPNISAALRLQCTRAETPARFKDTSQAIAPLLRSAIFSSNDFLRERSSSFSLRYASRSISWSRYAVRRR